MNILKILAKSLQITYRKDFIKSVWFLLRPSILMIIGTIIAIAPTGVASSMNQQGLLSPAIALCVIVIFAIIGLLIIFKAFWDYVLAFLAVIYMTKNADGNEKILTLKEYLNLIEGRKGLYVKVLLATAVLLSAPIAICGIPSVLYIKKMPHIATLMISSGAILTVFIFIKLAVIYQVYAFKPAYSFGEIFKKSYDLTSGYFWQTLLLMIVIQIPPQIASFVFMFFTSNAIIETAATGIITALYMPVYIVALTLWYFELKRGKTS